MDVGIYFFVTHAYLNKYIFFLFNPGFVLLQNLPGYTKEKEQYSTKVSEVCYYNL